MQTSNALSGGGNVEMAQQMKSPQIVDIHSQSYLEGQARRASVQYSEIDFDQFEKYSESPKGPQHRSVMSSQSNLRTNQVHTQKEIIHEKTWKKHLISKQKNLSGSQTKTDKQRQTKKQRKWTFNKSKIIKWQSSKNIQSTSNEPMDQQNNQVHRVHQFQPIVLTEMEIDSSLNQNIQLQTKQSLERIFDLCAKLVAFCLLNEYGKHVFSQIQQLSSRFENIQILNKQFQVFLERQLKKQNRLISQEIRLSHLHNSMINLNYFEEDFSAFCQFFNLQPEIIQQQKDQLRRLGKIFSKITSKSFYFEKGFDYFKKELNKAIRQSLELEILNDLFFQKSLNQNFNELFYEKSQTKILFYANLLTLKYSENIQLIEKFKNQCESVQKEAKNQKKSQEIPIQRGFNKLNPKNYLDNAKTFELLIKDEYYHKWQPRKYEKGYQYKVYVRNRNFFGEQLKLTSVTLQFFKIYTLNMDFIEEYYYKKQNKTYKKSELKARVKDIIAELKKAFEDGFNIIFLQQIAHRQARKILRKALQSKELKCIYPHFYWNDTNPEPWNTLILSKYPARFGQLNMKISQVDSKNQVYNHQPSRIFCEFRIKVDGQKKTIRFLSAHLKADRFDKSTGQQIRYPNVRRRQIELLDHFGQTCDYFFVVGDTNIGTRVSVYGDQNIYLSQKFVDFLELKCNEGKLLVDKDGRIYGTFMWKENGELYFERMDRNLIKVKGVPIDRVKELFIAHTEVEHVELSSCINQNLDRQKVFKNLWQYINISDHSPVKSLVGFAKYK